MTPRASDRHRGASSPLNAGTKYTPAVSSTLAASSSDSAAELMTCAARLAHRVQGFYTGDHSQRRPASAAASCKGGICIAGCITCSLSRSQLTPAPAMAMLPARTAGSC